jgi:hypothetical protein
MAKKCLLHRHEDLTAIVGTQDLFFSDADTSVQDSVVPIG